MSRRYCETPTWRHLIDELSALNAKSADYYISRSKRNPNEVDNYPLVTSHIAEEFHDRWWSDPLFAEERSNTGTNPHGRECPLKMQAVKPFQGIGIAPDLPSSLHREIEALKSAYISGVVTTNFDCFLEEEIFPSYKTYVGQSGLLFSDSIGIGEIYKIHGCCRDYRSVVLTQNDYEVFREKQAVLAAKLLMMFVEAPVIFLGYSISDPNILKILEDLITCLDDSQAQKLAENLIFVEWGEGDGSTRDIQQVKLGSDFLGITKVSVPNFVSLFDFLGRPDMKRRPSPELLRHIHGAVFSLSSGDASGIVKVFNDDYINEHPDKAEIAVGVGTVSQKAYVGMGRDDLLDDVLRTRGSDLEPLKVCMDLLPKIAKGKSQTAVPVFRYLRASGMLENDGSLKDAVKLDPRLKDYIERYPKRSAGNKSQAKRAKILLGAGSDLQTLIEVAGDDREFLLTLPFLETESMIDLSPLRDRLVSIRRTMLDDSELYSELLSSWAKAVCIYDFYEYSSLGS